MALNSLQWNQYAQLAQYLQQQQANPYAQQMNPYAQHGQPQLSFSGAPQFNLNADQYDYSGEGGSKGLVTGTIGVVGTAAALAYGIKKGKPKFLKEAWNKLSGKVSGWFGKGAAKAGISAETKALKTDFKALAENINTSDATIFKKAAQEVGLDISKATPSQVRRAIIKKALASKKPNTYIKNLMDKGIIKEGETKALAEQITALQKSLKAAQNQASHKNIVKDLMPKKTINAYETASTKLQNANKELKTLEDKVANAGTDKAKEKTVNALNKQIASKKAEIEDLKTAYENAEKTYNKAFEAASQKAIITLEDGTVIKKTAANADEFNSLNRLFDKAKPSKSDETTIENLIKNLIGE